MTLRRTLMALPLLTLASLTLSGCVDNPISRHFEWQKHEETVEFAPEPLYCYRTLAHVTCYAQPLDRREANRVVNYYGPSPGRIVAAPAPALPQEKMGPPTQYPPLMVPRDKVESEPLPLVPPKQQSKLEVGSD